MSAKRLTTILVVLLAIFMVATVIIAIWQGPMGWGWWWTLPLGGGFVLVVLGFRLVIQKMEEENRRRDAELDAEFGDEQAQ